MKWQTERKLIWLVARCVFGLFHAQSTKVRTKIGFSDLMKLTDKLNRIA